MPSLILNGDDVSVRTEGLHLEVVRRKPGGEANEFVRMRVPIVDLDRMVVVGNPGVTLPALLRVARNGVPIFFLSASHRWIGALSPDDNKNAARRVRQYEMAKDEKLALEVARRIVLVKIKNSRRVLQRLSANREQSYNSAQIEAAERLDQLTGLAARVAAMDELRGVEGMAAAIYFQRLGAFFPEKTPFKERSRRPPKDAANALLSWTYTIVLGEVEAAARSHGLDPCLGFLHAVSHGSPSLALDLLEPLRAPVCDLLALHLLNHKVLTDESFEFRSEDGGTYLREDARKSFFMSYETSMARKFTVGKDTGHTDFRKVIDDQVVNILKALEGRSDYEFFEMP